MFKSILMPLAIGVTVALGGAAFADGVTKKPGLYKESPTKAPEAAKDKSVVPGAQESNARYKNTEKVEPGVRDKAVNPDAPINEDRYKSTKKAPGAEKMQDTAK
jgi:hypothetical protein